MKRRTIILLLVCLVQLGLVGAATSAQLSARLTGEVYLLRVQPIDPIDPFRGAYVTLSYPDLRWPDSGRARSRWSDRSQRIEEGSVYVPLMQRGEAWKGGRWVRNAPVAGPYLKCESEHGSLRCGIESFFVPQDKARALQHALDAGQMYAQVKIDSHGHAAIVGLVAR